MDLSYLSSHFVLAAIAFHCLPVRFLPQTLTSSPSQSLCRARSVRAPKPFRLTSLSHFVLSAVASFESSTVCLFVSYRALLSHTLSVTQFVDPNQSDCLLFLILFFMQLSPWSFHCLPLLFLPRILVSHLLSHSITSHSVCASKPFRLSSLSHFVLSAAASFETSTVCLFVSYHVLWSHHLSVTPSLVILCVHPSIPVVFPRPISYEILSYMSRFLFYPFCFSFYLSQNFIFAPFTFALVALVSVQDSLPYIWVVTTHFHNFYFVSNSSYYCYSQVENSSSNFHY